MKQNHIEITLTSLLPSRYREALEQLFYFNPNQQRIRSAIISAVARFGNPRMFVEADTCRIAVDKFDQAQTLYALEDGPAGRLVGCIVFVRDIYERISIIYIAVAEERTMASCGGEVPLAAQLFDHVLKAARQIKGVRTVVVPRGHGTEIEPAATSKGC